MMRLALATVLALVTSAGLATAQTPAAPPATPQAPPPAGPGGAGNFGRYQLVVVPGHAGSPFLIDSTTGCVWHIVQNAETKRSTFIEIDVENLHWSWGSGSQQLLAARVDSSNLPDDQKRALKQEVQKTGCGVSPVVLTPTLVETPKPGAQPPAAPATPGQPPPARPATPPRR